MDAREPLRLPTSEPLSLTAGSSSYGGGVPSSSITTMALTGMLPTNMRLPFNSIPQSSPKPMEASASLYHADNAQPMQPLSSVLSISEPVKKKRGRPRKYGPEGNMAIVLSPLSPSSGYSNSPMTDPSAKRRGRPPGSGKKQQLEALGSAGTSFTPHVITVKAGEDVASKILAFSQQGSRTVCILSANGTICNVTLRQPATSGGTVTYEGRFEILSLSGSYLLIENGGTRSRTGGLSVSLAGSDGRVFGGGVAGMLMAATPVQVFMGSFGANGKKLKPTPITHEPTSAPPQIPGFGTGSVASPPLQGTTSESSDDPGSPNGQSGGTCNNLSQHVQSVPSYASVGWPHSMVQHRHDPNVKMAHN